ncbi:MAG: hypothetical protein K2H95_02670, partial [Bacteroidales bacterium]|nr:hypothetical protein [Bacteroidales bacterium]
VQRCQGYSVLHLQTRQDLCVVQGNGAGKYASQLLKAAARATPKGSLRTLCAGDAENEKQPGFYVEPNFFQR